MSAPHMPQNPAMPELSIHDPRLTWHGAISIERHEDWAQPWRLPYAERGLFAPELHGPAKNPAGVRLTLMADTRVIGLRLLAHDREARPISLVRDGVHVADAEISPDGIALFSNQPAGTHRYELWLPQNVSAKITGVLVDDVHAVTASIPLPRRWITYGSSITHCKQASAPALTWPALVALKHNVDLTCLGYGGQCHLDPLVARVIGSQPADAISIKVGINIQGNGSLNQRTFRPNLIAFVRLIREAHPNVPLAVISPIFAPVRETMLNRVDLNLTIMREHIAAACEILQAHGDTNLRYLDGHALLGPDDLLRLPDFLHPDTVGYGLMAERFSAQLGDFLFGERPERHSAAPLNMDI